MFMEEADRYKKVYRVDGVLSNTEKEYFEYLISTYESSKSFPSEKLFVSVFPSTAGQFKNSREIEETDLRTYIFNLIDARVNTYISLQFNELKKEIQKKGITTEIADKISKLEALSNRNKAKNIDINLDARKAYENLKARPVGLQTGIHEVDDRIGGMNPGTVTTIAGFTSQFKCVSEHERIQTDKGLLTVKEIHDYGLHFKLKVQSEYGFRPLVAVHDEGNKQSYIIRIGGIPIETSPVHRFRVFRNNKLRWVQAKNLKVGDKVVQTLKRAESTITYTGMGEDYWEAIGAILGGKSKEVTPEEPKGFINSKFFSFLEKYTDRYIFPDSLYYAPIENQKAFIRGIWEKRENSEKELSLVNKSENVLYGISKILAPMGVSSDLIREEDSYKLVIREENSVKRFIELFSIQGNFYSEKREFEGLDAEGQKEVEDAELIWNTVTDIKQSSCYMYDLTVECSPTYVLNGYVTHNTTFALNIARLNSYYLGMNICYISLETPKTDIEWEILSCHSYEPHLSRFNFVGHDKMRRGKMTPEEEDFIFNEVEPDLHNDYIGKDGKTHKRGKIVILDESDFKTFSFGEISAVLEKVDDALDGKLDAVFVDYIQLCKFSGEGFSIDANAQINSYVTFFRRLAQNFRKVKDEEGNYHTKMLTMVLLAQINRTSWQKSAKNEGKYDITCLADSNELERGSYRVFTTFTNEEMKARNSAQVQILKNRTGQTMYEPVTVYANGACCVFQDEDSSRGAFADAGINSMDSAFSMLDDSDIDSLL